jgi:hypothetical protein
MHLRGRNKTIADADGTKISTRAFLRSEMLLVMWRRAHGPGSDSAASVHVWDCLAGCFLWFDSRRAQLVRVVRPPQLAALSVWDALPRPAPVALGLWVPTVAHRTVSFRFAERCYRPGGWCHAGLVVSDLPQDKIERWRRLVDEHRAEMESLVTEEARKTLQSVVNSYERLIAIVQRTRDRQRD